MFYPIIREFPMVNFIIGHFGIQTGGNYSFESFWMAMDTPNVYCESGWCFQSRIVEFAQQLPKNKIVFGTDSPPNDPGMCTSLPSASAVFLMSRSTPEVTGSGCDGARRCSADPPACRSWYRSWRPGRGLPSSASRHIPAAHPFDDAGIAPTTSHQPRWNKGPAVGLIFQLPPRSRLRAGCGRMIVWAALPCSAPAIVGQLEDRHRRYWYRQVLSILSRQFAAVGMGVADFFRRLLDQ